MEFTIDELLPSVGSFQDFIFGSLVLCDAASLTSMYPYVYFYIKNFDIGDDDANIFIYSGYLGAVFTLSQFISTSFWIKSSNRFGNKTARLFSSTGTAFSIVLYGLSTNFYMALLARSMLGFFHGYIFISRSTAVGAVAHDKTCRRRLSGSFMSMWRNGQSLGYIYGALNTGFSLYYDGLLPSKYRFLPSNLLISAFTVVHLIIGWLFLDETHEQRKYERDIGVEVGDFIKRSLGFKVPERPWKLREDIKASQLLDKMESSEMNNNLTKNDTSQVDFPGAEDDLTQKESESKDEQELLSPMSLKDCITGVFMISFQQCIYFEFLPVLLASTLRVEELKFPLHVRGGFGFKDEGIGNLLSVTVTFGMLMTVLLPLINKYISTKRVLKAGLLAYPIIYFLLPLFVFTRRQYNEGNPILTFVLLGVTGTIVSFIDRICCDHIKILFTKVSSNTSRELIESYAMTVSTLASCAAQIIGGLLISKFDEQGYGELSWWLLSIWSLMTFLHSVLIVK
ncbi:predicted protein [Scheffersomyces stipitis CBS 6054]|uniref:Uncharacterized protein n=1 Tax=Scheffersomyces stipitis (strain ATCC 58785 / CBS 6054 / NBRC 10063 / NRRL Y-11545) TaxID=322104 RepID=A3LVX6_PICST|nr:predicted protein [Scheffersomyces stipitis CBS 6054]ABN67194.2 predicted protein [Scheffersomyces stipitis CBS 6054]